jgi:hypothetical protein
MTRITSLAAVLSMAAGLAFAGTWTGKLVDADCWGKLSRNNSQPAECTPTATTRKFAIQTTDGKVFKLDSAGNTKAAEAIKGNTKPNLRATVNGESHGRTVKVETISVQ